MKEVLAISGNLRINLSRVSEECYEIGVGSLSIVFIISIFIGIVISIQIASNLLSPLTPKFVVGLAARNMVILEIAPTILAIVLTGKIGTNISSQVASMRITEQIDALEIFGLNTKSYLVLPKIIAFLLCYPCLVVISILFSLFSGYWAAVLLTNVSSSDFIEGLTIFYRPLDLKIALYKSFTFAFLISSISSYIGYYTTGGAIEIGRASTKAFTISAIAILIFDYIIAQLLLKF